MDDEKNRERRMTLLKYGNTNTFLINGLLIDTDYAGTLGVFYREIKSQGIKVSDLKYVLATHYHPDHCGLIGELQRLGVRLVLTETQVDSVHFPDYIFQRDGIRYIPVNEKEAMVIKCADSRAFLQTLGIEGKILSTPNHSRDSVSVILDSGECIVGDLQRREYDPELEDWKNLMKRHPRRICYGHGPMEELAE